MGMIFKFDEEQNNNEIIKKRYCKKYFRLKTKRKAIFLTILETLECINIVVANTTIKKY